MFVRPYNLICYAIVFTLIVVGTLIKTNATAYLGVLIFLLWDVSYYFSKSGFEGRNVSDLSNQIFAARQYISYFLPFYGVLFGILFTLESESRQSFFTLASSAGISVWILVSPFLLSAIPIMFFPIQTHQDSATDGSPTSSLKGLFVLNVFCQKVSIFIFVHVLFRILWTIYETK